MEQLPDLTKSYKPLLSVGSLIGVLGVGLITAISMNWQLCVDKVKVPGAAQAATAAVGVLLIGAALIYAGMGRKNATAAR